MSGDIDDDISDGGGYFLSSKLRDILEIFTKKRSILLTGCSQSGKSSALEAVAQELQRASKNLSPLLITPELLASDSPGDATRGLLSAFMKGRADWSKKRRTSGIEYDSEGTEIGKYLILIEDLDLIAPSRGGSNDVVRVIMKELRNCESSNTLILATSSEPSRIHSGVLCMFEKHVTLGILNLYDRNDALLYFVRKTIKLDDNIDKESIVNAISVLADTACMGFLIGDIKFVVQETHRRLSLSFHGTSTDDIFSSSNFLKLLEDVISEHTPYQLIGGGRQLRVSSDDNKYNRGRRIHPSIIEIVDLRSKELIDAASHLGHDENDKEGDYADDEDDEEDSNTYLDSPRSPLSLSISNSIRPRSERTTFDDICGQEEAKDAIIKSVLWHRDPKRSVAMRNLGVSPPTGLMLYGPPGTGKTMLAKAVAGTIQGRFIEIKIPNILSSGVGDSERALKAAFDAAQNAAPAIIFIDEIQALFCRRDGGGNDNDDKMSSLLTSQLLLSLDALCRNAERDPDAGRVIVIAATNVPEALDPAFLRPGRFDKLILVGLPNEEDRFGMIQRKNRVMFPDLTNDDNKSLSARLAKLTEGFSGAEIENIFRVAALIAVTDFVTINKVEEPNSYRPKLTQEHLISAIERIKN